MKELKQFRWVVLLAIFGATTCLAQTNDSSLVQIDSRDYGGNTNVVMTVVELKRDGNTSLIKVVHEKGRNSAVGSSMFIMMAFYEVAKARNYEYFTNLKEWDGKNGSWFYIAGFTNKKDADLKKEFGDQYNYENESGQKRPYMSVSELKGFFRKPDKKVEPPVLPNTAPSRRQ